VYGGEVTDVTAFGLHNLKKYLAVVVLLKILSNEN
jgi:hypothetical protein